MIKYSIAYPIEFWLQIYGCPVTALFLLVPCLCGLSPVPGKHLFCMLLTCLWKYHWLSQEPLDYIYACLFSFWCIFHTNFKYRVLEFNLNRDVPPKPQNPYPFLPKKVPISKDFSRNIGPFFKICGCSHGKHPTILEILDGKHPKFWTFSKNWPMSKGFPLKSGPMSKDFLWKNNPFGQHIPV